MPRRPLPPRLTLAVPILAFCATLAAAVSGQEPLKPQGLPAYKLGQAIPVSCLNRTMYVCPGTPRSLASFGRVLTCVCLRRDTGEHITDEKGQLQYIPFPTCNETGRPLELSFGVEQGEWLAVKKGGVGDAVCSLDTCVVLAALESAGWARARPRLWTGRTLGMSSAYCTPPPFRPSTAPPSPPPVTPLTTLPELNCTIDFISDPLFHLLEFYIHNDAPLTCRIPSRPLSTTTTTTTTSSSSPVSSSDPLTPPPYTPLIFALTGTLQLSHLHISPHLNVLLHAAPRALAPGAVAAATAYSVAPAGEHARLVIGDALPLRLSVRWYPGTALPSGWAGVGGHVYWSTLAYCVISAGVGAVAAGAWVRAFWLPGRLRRERVGGEAGYGAGRYAGYGVGVGGAANGFGYGVGVGKRD